MRGAEQIGLLREFADPVEVMLAGIVAQRAIRPAVNFLFRLLVPFQPEIAEL